MFANLIDIRLDLLSVGIAIAGIGVLGFAIYFNNRKSITNRTFLIFSLLTILWGISNYLEYKFDTVYLALHALRLHLFISVWHAFFFFQLCFVFPAEEKKFPTLYKWLLIPGVIITSVVTLTPFVFSKIVALAPAGQVTNPVRGPGIALFAVVAFGLLFAGIGVLYAKTRHLEVRGVARSQNDFMLAGMSLTACLIIAFNVILPITFNNLSFIPLGAVFLFPVIACTAYAIARYKLFNIKVIGTALVTFALSIVSFVEIIFANTPELIIFRICVFVLVLIFSINLIRGVLREVEQREQIQAQATQLESFIHFLSHEVKGILGKNRDTYQALTDGDFGDLPTDAKPFVGQVLHDTNDAIDMVMNILHSTDFKSGKMQLNMQPFDLKQAVSECIESLRKDAEDKGLSITEWLGEGENFTIIGDKENLTKHVIRNLIDNAIKYTPKGEIVVRLEKRNDKAVLSIKDSGVGLTPEDKQVLFTEGGRGKDSVKVNVHSTGFGLFFSKNITEAHHGRVWAESEGYNKGSTFFVELPLKNS